MNERDLMRRAISACGLDRQAICRAARREGAARLQKGEPDMKKRKLTVAAAVVLAAACLGGGVYAAGVLLSAPQAAEAMGESDVAALFEGDEAVAVNQTQSDAGYDVTLLGLVTGEHLTENWNSSWGDDGPENGTTYAVVAVRKSDGTPMPEVTDAADDFYPSETFAQPVLAIPELDPMAYTLHVEAICMTADGVRYLLVACDNVEIFADRDVVLCVSTGGSGFSNFAFYYDEATGAITAEPDYAGVNLVFDLPLDAAKADPTAAQAFLDEWQAKPSSGVSWQDRADTSALHSLMEKYPEAVRAIGTQTNVETAPYRQEAPEGYWDIGPGWYFGDPDDQVYGSYGVGEDLGAQSGPAVGETWLSSMNTDSNAQERWVYLMTRNEDDSMTAERWDLPYDAQELYRQLNAWIAENA